MRQAIGICLIVVGLGCLAISEFLIWQRQTPTRLAFKLSELKSTDISTSSLDKNPTVLAIPSLNIVLPIIATTLKNSKWQATGEGISYLISSPQPGEIGNSIMYGHNWPNLLGKLPRVKPGQMINITFTDGSKKVFAIEFTSVVTPDQTHILNPTSDHRLTLYTCTGLLDRKRFVVTAILKQSNLDK